jgi:hypothetical protein
VELGTPTVPSTVVRLALELQRERLWRRAARQDGRELELWVLRVVDEAARRL